MYPKSGRGFFQELAHAFAIDLLPQPPIEQRRDLMTSPSSSPYWVTLFFALSVDKLPKTLYNQIPSREKTR